MRHLLASRAKMLTARRVVPLCLLENRSTSLASRDAALDPWHTFLL